MDRIVDVVLNAPGLIAFWDMQEDAGEERASRGPIPLRLKEGGGPVERAADGVFGPYSARFGGGTWLSLPRPEASALNAHGPNAEVSVIAWVKREAKKGSNECEAVAGMWNETLRQRQYCLFLNLGIWDSAQQAAGHVSSIGGPTPGYKYCMDASIGRTPVPLGIWQCVAFTYDGVWVKTYLNGELDARGDRNPYRYEGGLFDGGPDGADFTVGAVYRAGEMGNWYAGALGGLAVFDRALTAEEMRSIGTMRM